MTHPGLKTRGSINQQNRGFINGGLRPADHVLGGGQTLIVVLNWGGAYGSQDRVDPKAGLVIVLMIH